MHIAGLIHAAKDIKFIFGALESGEVASMFGDIELSAAAEAFRRIPQASDRSQQIGICIGHLNSAYHSYAASLRNRGFLDRMLFTRGEHFEAVKTKAAFVLSVRALCHAYREEMQHAAEDIALVRRMRSTETQDSGGMGVWFVSGALFNPLVAIDAVYMIAKNETGSVRRYELADADISKLETLLGLGATPAES